MTPSTAVRRRVGVSAASSGGIFISYRRLETSHLAGRLYDRLVDRFGEAQVFMDVDTIDLGVDFAEVISRAVGTCSVLLVIIGPEWLTVTDEQGRRRLKNPDDFVRLEVQAALERDVRVIPILAEGAAMPRRQDLPRPLARLARRNALTMRHDSFRYDAERLVEAIERVLGPGDVIAGPQGARALHLGHEVNAVAFSPDGGLLATGSADQTARIWDIPSGQERTRLAHGEGVAAVAFSPDGRLLATGSADQTARIWDAASGQERTRLSHDEGVLAVAFSPDGGLLATGSFDPTARIWDATSGQLRAELTHGGAVWAVAFSPDGRLLATGSADQTARIWDAASGQERARVTHDGLVAAVAFSPDGRLLATGSFDGTARTWTVLS
jgi:roadblock/LC7 domain-containing protein